MRLNEIILFSKRKLLGLKVQALVLGQIISHAKFSKRYVLHEIIFSQAKIKTIGKSTQSILSGTGKDVLYLLPIG